MGEISWHQNELCSWLTQLTDFKTAPVLAAVSGGPDSMFLMRWLHGKKALAGVVHVNHQLRGEDSEADATFVKEQCAKLDVPCHIVVAPVVSEPGNLENNARNARYRAFEEIAKKLSVRYVATGHTSDDHTETILFRLIRGTGLAGLRGIPLTRIINHITIIRPILIYERQMILRELEKLDQAYRTDKSNVDPRHTRNRIRHELLPLLRTFNPKIDYSLQNIAIQADQFAYRQECFAKELLDEVELPRSQLVVVLSFQKLLLIDEKKLPYIMQFIWEREFWPEGDMQVLHWNHLNNYVGGERKPFDLPGGLRIERRGNVILIGPRAAILGR